MNKEHSEIKSINLLYSLLLYYLFKGILYLLGMGNFSIIPSTRGDLILFFAFLIGGSLLIHYFLMPLIKILKKKWDEFD